MNTPARSSLAYAEMLLHAGKATDALVELESWAGAERATFSYIRLRSEVLLRLGRLDELRELLASLSHEDTRSRAFAALFFARIDARAGNWDSALRTVTEAPRCDDASVNASLFQLKGNAQIHAGSLSEGQESLRNALSLYETSRETKKIAQCLATLGICERRLGNLEVAQSCFVRARETAAGINDRVEHARACQNLGSVYLVLGQLLSAATEFEHALALSKETGIANIVVRARQALALLRCRQGRFSEARRHFTEVVRTHVSPQEKVATYEYLGELRLAEGHFHRARRLFRRAIRIGRALGDPEAQFEPQYRLAEAELGLENPARARELAVEARDDFAARGDRLESAFAARVAAQALLCQKQWDQAITELEMVRSTLEELGEQFEIHRVRRLLDAARESTPIFDIHLVERRLRPAGSGRSESLSDASAGTTARGAAHGPATGDTSGAPPSLTGPNLVCGQSRTFLDFLAEVDLHAQGITPILLEGETGVGKELIARRIHAQSPRAQADFIPFNCGTSTPELFDSELFGYVRGAFTGAQSGRRGLARAANNGTLLLDEIGELTKESQARLLRFLDNGEVRSVGSDSIEWSDVRVISATHQDLDRLVAEGTFRRDLFFRLNTVRLRVPPLRERTEDIELLVRHFLEVASHYGMGEVEGISSSVLGQMRRHTWPGNVRELRSEVFWLARQNAGTTVEQWTPRFKGAVAPELPTELSLEILEDALHQANGSPTVASRFLNVHRMVIYRLVERYGIDLTSFKK